MAITVAKRERRQPFPAASTVKLAMVADLLVRERRGSVRLAPADEPLIDAALRESADGAADRLWHAYENAASSAGSGRSG
jgi:hypothetical protein